MVPDRACSAADVQQVDVLLLMSTDACTPTGAEVTNRAGRNQAIVIWPRARYMMPTTHRKRQQLAYTTIHIQLKSPVQTEPGRAC